MVEDSETESETKPETEIEEGYGDNRPDRSSRGPRRGGSSSHQEPETLETELNFFLDRPLSYLQDPRFSDRMPLKDNPSSPWSELHIDMKHVQRNRLEGLTFNQNFTLVQLLYHAAFAKRRENRKLEKDLRKAKDDLDQANWKHDRYRAKLRVERARRLKLN